MCNVGHMVLCILESCVGQFNSHRLWVLESCVGQVNPRGLQVSAFVGQVQKPALLCVRVELAVGRGRLYLLHVRGGRRLRNSLCG